MTSSDSLIIIKRVVRSQGHSARRLDALRDKLEAVPESRPKKEGGLLAWFRALIGLDNREDRHGVA